MSNRLTFLVTWGGIALAGISVIARIYLEFAGGDSSVPVLVFYVPWVIGLAVAATGVVLERRKGTLTPSLNRDSPDGSSQSPTMVAPWTSERDSGPELSR